MPSLEDRFWQKVSKDGGWVQAEEAEARIKELEERVRNQADAVDHYRAESGKAEARLRAADELADAAERYGKMFSQGNWMKAWNACLAYREAGK
jgi:hypothetical protein